MGKKTFTWRANADEHAAAVAVSSALGLSLNAFVSRAVRDAVAEQGADKAEELEALAAKLRAFAESGGSTKAAKDAFIEAEVEHPDPLEGKAFDNGLQARIQSKLRA